MREPEACPDVTVRTRRNDGKAENTSITRPLTEEMAFNAGSRILLAEKKRPHESDAGC